MKTQPGAKVLIVLFLAVAAGSCAGVVFLQYWTQRCAFHNDQMWDKLYAQGGDAPLETANGVRQTLHLVQQGYVARNPNNLDSFIDQVLVPGESVSMIGIERGETLRGRQAVRRFFEIDWRYWGDFRFNADQALVWSSGDTAWFATQGQVQLASKSPVLLTGILVRSADRWRIRQLQFQIQKCPQPGKRIWPLRLLGEAVEPCGM